MRINHNIAALNTYRQLGSANNAQQASMEKLSSGLRINKAGDDAAGLAISEKMRAQIKGLDMAAKNSQDGISMLQTAEGALNETHDILQRMRELATQAANDTNTTDDRKEIQKEMNQLTSEINRIGNTTEFNTQKLLDGGEAQRAAATKSPEAPAAEGTAAVLTGAKDATTGATLGSLDKITVNGKDVTLTETKKLDNTSGNEATIDNIVKNLQKDLDEVFKDGEKITVTNDGDKLVFTSAAKGAEAKIEVTASTDSATLGLTTDDATKNSAAGKAAEESNVSNSGSSFTASLQIGANKGQAFGISILDMRAAALGISQAVSGGSQVESKPEGTAAVLTGAKDATTGATLGSLDKITVNGKDVTLTETKKLDNTSGNEATIDNIVKNLQKDLDEVFKDGEKITVTNDGDKLVFTSAAKGAEAKIEVTASTDSATLGLTTDDATKNSAAGKAAEDAKESGSTFSSEAEVTNGTTNGVTEAALDVTSHASATNAIDVLDKAIAKVSGERSKLGAYQNRLDHTINNLSTSSENLTAAESRIRDVDYVLAA